MTFTEPASADPEARQEQEPVADIQRPLRIALLGYRSNPYSGGQGIYIKYLSKALADLGHQVDVWSGPPYPELDPRVRLREVPSLGMSDKIKRLKEFRLRFLLSPIDTFEYLSTLSGGFPEPYTFGLRLLRSMGAELNDYDIVHDNQSLNYALLRLQKKIPLVTTIHHPITSDLAIDLQSARNIGHRLLIRRWYTFLRMQKKVVPALRHVLTVSDQSRRDIARAFRLPVEQPDIIFNGIDTDLFRPVPDIRRENNLLMATASADAPLKGLRYLIEALAILRRDRPDLRLLVVGKPKKDGSIERQIRRLGLTDAVDFVHGISTEELVRCYARATLAVVPSLYEGFGLPAGEAMSCGVPLISTRGGALPEVVGDAGMLVPVRDAAAIAAATGRLLQDDGLRQELSEKGRRRIENEFSWQVTARRMQQYYHKAIGEFSSHANR